VEINGAARLGNTTVGLCGLAAITERPLEADIVVKSDVVGEGIGGRVYLAERKQTGAQCVVKSFRKQHLSKHALSALKNEVEVHASLAHPLIAKLEDVYESPTSVHLVLEHLEGGELFDKISKHGHLGEAESARLVTQLLTATTYLHAQGIIHGDLKPENAVFDRKGDKGLLKLIDFGLARRWDQKIPISDLQGTIGYAAPEVFLGSCTDKVDLWSVGIMTYTMLCGCSPWRGSDARMKRDIAAGEPYFHRPKWDPLSSEVKDFIVQLLQKDPRRRPSAVEAMSHPWLLSHYIPDGRTCVSFDDHKRAASRLQSQASTCSRKSSGGACSECHSSFSAS